MARTFHEIFEHLLNFHAPLKKRKVRNEYAPWITSDIKRGMEERDRMKKLASKDPNLWPKYKILRNKVTNNIRLSDTKYYQELVTKNKNDPKKMGKTIDKILHKTSGTTTLSELKDGDTIVKGQNQIAEKLNEHFVNIGPKLASKLEVKPDDDPIKYLHPNDSDQRFSFKLMSEESMLRSLKMLKSGKAPGPDGVPTNLVKDAAKFIAKPLAMIFNASLAKGIVPDVWKLAKITPIFKTGARNEKNNYRPISVLSVFAKLFEKIVHDQLSDFLLSNRKLTMSQFAYRKLHSTITSLISVSDYWYENIDKNDVNFALFLDLKKAFDTVDHEILIRKLKVYGIDGIELEWFRSYLSCRQQYCTLNGNKSSSQQVTCGIPQGSCLGPLLFILYLNDFGSCLKFSRANLYADDTEVSFSSNELSDVASNFQAELKNISEWMRINKLSIHPEKTEFMVIDHPRRQSKLPELQPFYLDNIRIKQVHKTKYLGLTVDDKLSWNEQYKSVKGKVAGGLASLRKLKNILPQSQLLNVYQALVESHLRYANVVWGALSSTKLSTLQRYQDRAFNLIESSRIKDDYNKNILNVNQLMTFDRAVMTFKIVNQLCPESLQNKFIERSALSKYNTRNMKDLHVQKLKLEHTKKSFLYTGPKAWNSIPQLIRDTGSVVRFKKDLKSHLFS